MPEPRRERATPTPEIAKSAMARATADEPFRPYVHNKTTYRILVTGSRTWDDVPTLAFELGAATSDGLQLGRKPVIIHGDCPSGADALAGQIARDHGLLVEPHPADWTVHGKSAGFRRNAEMVELGADVCLAFIRDGSRGATHCGAGRESRDRGTALYRLTCDVRLVPICPRSGLQSGPSTVCV